MLSGKNQLFFALHCHSLLLFLLLHSVLESDVPEEVAHALLVMDPPDALRQQDRNVHGLLQKGADVMILSSETNLQYSNTRFCDSASWLTLNGGKFKQPSLHLVHGYCKLLYVYPSET